jgi:hypothetical protein
LMQYELSQVQLNEQRKVTIAISDESKAK